MVMVTESRSINPPIRFLNPSAMSTAENQVLKTKFKIGLKQLRNIGESIEVEGERPNQKFPSTMGRDCLRISDNATRSSHPCGINRQLSLNSESGPTTTAAKNRRTPEMTKVHKSTENRSCLVETSIAANSKGESFVKCAYKRGPVGRLDGQKVKKQKIDSNVLRQCAAILKKLMTHPTGWVFNQPVDPVKLNIPDYFSIISDPMDLGTIKSKLDKKLYSDAQEFAADVRLTFSNAMLYNPPSNGVHVMASGLNDIFLSRWKVLETKWNEESLKLEQKPISKERQKNAQNVRRNSHKTPASCLNLHPKMSMTFAQKQKLRKYLMEISKGRIPPHLLDVLRRFDAVGPNEERIKVDIDAFDENKAWELLRVLGSYLDSRIVESVTTENSCGRDFLQDRHKGTGNGNRSAGGSVKVKSCTSSSTCINGLCGSMNCQCSRHNDFTQASSGLDSEGSSDRDNTHVDHGVVFNQGPLTIDTTSGRRSKLDHDSDGAVSAVDEENIQLISHPVTPVAAAASGEGWENDIYEGHLSPSKALRAAMLRSRFADTILKAQHKTLLSNGEKVDPVKMQQEKERLEKQQREEKARIEAQIRAAEAASREREEAELKMQREKEREAARIALQKMEKTVEIDENVSILKDLEMLGGFSESDNLLGNGVPRKGGVDGIELELGAAVESGGHHGNLLERLGLFMKDEYLEEEEEVAVSNGGGDVEEGEIAS